MILSSCNPHFIRCLKSNEGKKPNYLDENLIFTQLKYSGVLLFFQCPTFAVGLLETVKIRRMGYAVRLTFDAFISKCVIKKFKVSAFSH